MLDTNEIILSTLTYIICVDEHKIDTLDHFVSLDHIKSDAS